MENRTIAPMLLIPFVENAFKHGHKHHEPGIMIDLNILTDRMAFHVTNYVKPKDQRNKEEAGGFGLENIKRRLGLLYPDKHDLKLNLNGDIFKVELTIYN